jgi:UDP-N-acetylmuramoylalanine--D-glutamate ligase
VNVKDLQVTVVGLARSGVGAARLLNHLGARVTLADRKEAQELTAILSQGGPVEHRREGGGAVRVRA